MQKKLMYIVFLLLTVCKAAAQDLMTVSSFSLGAGDTKEVGVQLTNADTYVGFQFDLYLPQGFTVESFTAGSRLPSGTTPQMAQQADGSYRFVAAALSGNAITGNSGSVLTLTVKAADAATAGSYDGYLRNVKISRADGSGVTIAEQPFTVTVLDNEPYAVYDAGTLTFYYDKRKEERGGMSVGPFNIFSERGWDSAASTITTVVFDSSFANYTNLTSTASWFYGCSNLTTIQGIANLNTANVTDMSMMFWSCSGLTSLDLSILNTANVIYMDQMFGNCSGLTSLDVSGFNTTQVTSMTMMFNNCSSLTSLDLSAFNTAHVTYMNGCFLGCSALTTVYVGADWSTAAVAEGGDMFTLCPSLVGGAFTTFDSNHTDHNYAHIDGGTQNPGYLTSIADKAEVAAVIFSRSLYELTMSCATENVRIMYAVITDPTAEPQYEQYTAPVTLTADCTVRAYAVRPSGIQSAYSEYTFSMSDVQTVEMPTMSWSGDEMTLATVTADATIHYILDAEGTVPQEQVYTAPVTVTSNVTISTWATKDEMQNSDTLTVSYPYTAWVSLVQAIAEAQDAVALATGKENVTVDSLTALQTKIDEASAAYAARSAEASAIEAMTRSLAASTAIINQLATAVKEPYAVLSADGLTVTFYYDYKKTEKEGMDINTSSSNPSPYGTATNAVFDVSFADYKPTSTAHWFENCSALTSIEGIANLKTDSVTNMSWMFLGCSGLTHLDLSGFNTNNVKEMFSMFYDCSSLTNIDVSGFNTANVTGMGGMFSGCSALTNLDVTGFNTAKVTDMSCMFERCSSLTNLDVSGFDTGNVTHMQWMFVHCSGLTILDLSSFNTRNATMMTQMFFECSALTTIYVGADWSTASVSYGDGVFGSCTSLVGGSFTAYDANHVDATYAHIDGGTQNPGYLTSIADKAEVAAVTFSRSLFELTMSCATENVHIMYAVITDPTAAPQWQQYTAPITLTADCTVRAYAVRPSGIQSDVTEYTFSMSDVQRVESPTLSWSGDELTLATVTAGAAIHYILDAEGTVPQEQVYTAPVTVTSNATISTWATKDEMQNSDTLTIVYPYTAWNALVQSIAEAQLLAREAATSDNVPAQMLTELQNQIDIAEALYQTRTATEPEIVDIRIALEAIMAEVRERVNAVAEPYAVLDGTTLTFYYDKKKEERGGMDINVGWQNSVATITEVVFDTSFANCTTLVSTALWFSNCTNLTQITGMENLNTSNVTSMNNMFYNCAALTSIDLSGFNTAKVEDMGGMFMSCSSLTSLDLSSFNTGMVTNMTAMFMEAVDLRTIYVGELWTTNSGVNSNDMFYGCTALVGGQGTTYDPDHVDADYAHIDGGTQNPGYLTDINLGPYQGTVAAPTFSWQGDELTITTATADAELFYQLSDTDVDGDGTVTDADYVLYTAPVEIRRNVTVKAYGAKQGLVNSDVTTLVYPYEAWERLMNTIKYAEEVVAQCQGSTKVTQQELDELALEARRASGLYNERTMTETEILDYANALEAAAADIWTRHNSTDNYSFDTATGVLTLQNGMTVTEAVNTIGGQVAESVTAILWQNTTPLTETDLAVISNPNLLVYVADSTLAPAGRDNVVADGVAKNVVLTSQGTGNIDFYCPQSFTVRRISYTREFVQQTTIGVSRGWESIALPFTVQRVEHQTQGAIVPFGSTEPGYRFWLRQLTANGLQSAQTIEANVGYLISMPNSSEYTEGNLGGVVTFSAENAEVPVTRPVVSESAQHALLPSFRRMAAQQGVYVLNVSAPRNGYAEGSIFEENYRELLPFQAYTEHLGTQPAPPYFVIGKMGGEGTTGIADVRADVEDTDYYDLNGRRLQGKPRQKGVYIRQGRKVIVR